MHDMDLELEQPCEAAVQVRVRRSNGRQVPVRLRLLGYEGCEFESDQNFVAGEQVSLEIYRMGSIRARITSQRGRVSEAEFDKRCPV